MALNWFLIFAAVVVTILVLVANVYLLIHYQHPEDRNQAWVPKIVIVFGLSVAILLVLMYPLDVANQKSCANDESPSSCQETLPMYEMWLAMFIANLVLVWAIIPFTLFFYEADSDFSWFQKVKGAVAWTVGMLVIIGLIIGILYSLVGYVIYPTQELESGTLNVSIILEPATVEFLCIPPLNKTNATSSVDLKLCDAGKTTDFQVSNWKLRVTLPVYIIAVQSVLGWILFLIFAGVGTLGAPIDWIQEFLNRPKHTITKSEYMRRGRLIAQRAREVVNLAQMMRRQDRDRRWRANFKRLEREALVLEEDEYQLERVYPQGEDGDHVWVVFMLSFYFIGLLGVIGLCLSLAWVAHICLYMLPRKPVSPMLNDVFVALDDLFSFLGVLAFSAFCLYLMVISMKGNMLLGLNFLVVKLYPMRPGCTMISSFLVNTAIILTMAPAVLQFCAQAFAVYADQTAIFDIFGNQVNSLMGISFIYQLNIFLYILLAIIVLSAFFMCFKGKKAWERKNPNDMYVYD